MLGTYQDLRYLSRYPGIQRAAKGTFAEQIHFENVYLS